LKNPIITRTLLGATAAIALVASATPANAGKPLDITSYQASDIVVTDPYCYPVKTTFKTSKKTDPTTVSVSVYRNGKEVASSRYLNSTKSRLLNVCPGQNGLGAYTIGNATIYTETKVKDRFGVNRTKLTKHVDKTTQTIYARAKTSSKLTSKRSGSTVTLNANAKTYVLGAWEYKPYKNAKAQLQVKKGNSWKTIKNLKLTNGKATVKVKDRSKKTYRLYIPQSTVSTATSSTTTR